MSESDIGEGQGPDDLGAPRDEELPGFLATVHTRSVPPMAWWVGCPASTPFITDFLTVAASGFLDRDAHDRPLD
jgi:hypothetical protein